jgi:hypothetical protein
VEGVDKKTPPELRTDPNGKELATARETRGSGGLIKKAEAGRVELPVVNFNQLPSAMKPNLTHAIRAIHLLKINPKHLHNR